MRRNFLGNPAIRWFLTGLNGALWVCAILLAILAVYILSPAGVRDMAVAHQKMLDELADESRAFCEKFGMPAGTKQHTRCLIELDAIRANEDQRVNAAANKLL